MTKLVPSSITLMINAAAVSSLRVADASCGTAAWASSGSPFTSGITRAPVSKP